MSTPIKTSDTPAPHAHPQRILSIDTMRGLTLFLMLFVNDVFIPGVPEWIGHTEADVDGMGLADWVFPGFLFMVGMAIPYAIRSRRKKGETNWQVFAHIIFRTISLLLIGVLMVNIGRLTTELTGINRNLWAVLLYIAIFLVWNQYPAGNRGKRYFTGLKTLGIIGLCILVFIFRAGEPGNVSWLTTSWWGILGLIGWGYFAGATVCLFVGERLFLTVGVWVFFVVLNMLSQWDLLGLVDFLNPVFGVIISGNIPSIVLAGLVISLILRRTAKPSVKTVLYIAALGLASLGIGFFLRQWFIVSKIYGTPSWGMICNGISMILYALLYLIVDYWQRHRWTGLFQAAGKNSLTTYLAPDVIYYACWGFGIPLFFYKQDSSQLLAITGSIGWAFAMIGFAMLLSKINIRLKL